LILDLKNCTRCDACVNACADAHDGVTRLVRDGLRFENYLVATSCRQCRDPLCMVGCPVGSIAAAIPSKSLSKTGASAAASARAIAPTATSTCTRSRCSRTIPGTPCSDVREHLERVQVDVAVGAIARAEAAADAPVFDNDFEELRRRMEPTGQPTMQRGSRHWRQDVATR